MRRSGEIGKRTEELAHWSLSCVEEGHQAHGECARGWSWRCSLNWGICMMSCSAHSWDLTQWRAEAGLEPQVGAEFQSLAWTEVHSGWRDEVWTAAEPSVTVAWSGAEQAGLEAKTGAVTSA